MSARFWRLFVAFSLLLLAVASVGAALTEVPERWLVAQVIAGVYAVLGVLMQRPAPAAARGRHRAGVA